MDGMTATLTRPTTAQTTRPIPADLLDKLQPYVAAGIIDPPFWSGDTVVALFTPRAQTPLRRVIYAFVDGRWRNPERYAAPGLNPLTCADVRPGSNKPGKFDVRWACGHVSEEFGFERHQAQAAQDVEKGRECRRCVASEPGRREGAVRDRMRL